MRSRDREQPMRMPAAVEKPAELGGIGQEKLLAFPAPDCSSVLSGICLSAEGINNPLQSRSGGVEDTKQREAGKKLF